MFSRLPAAFVLAALVALTACGGGGDAAAPAPVADGGDPPVSGTTPVTPTPTPMPDPTPTPTPTPDPTPTPPAPGASAVTTGEAVDVDRGAFGGAMAAADLGAAFGRIGAFVDAWKASRSDLASLTAEAYAGALAASLAGQADARYVNVSPTDFTVTVQLRDGSPTFFATRFAADGSPRALRKGSAPPAAAASKPMRPVPKPHAGFGPALQAAAQPGDPVLPLGRRVVFFNGFPTGMVDGVPSGSGHTPHHNEMRELFAAVGYAVETKTLTIENLITVGAVDILWIDTHAVDVRVRRSPLSDPVSTYVLVALAPRVCAALPAADCAPYREMLDSGVVVAGGGGLWGFSPRFVRSHLSFKSQRSLAVLDACETADPAPGPTAMRRAFQAVGAGLVYGWVHQVYAPTGQRVISEFFDAALGTNRYYRGPYTQRPFGVADVHADLENKGRTLDDFEGDAEHPPGIASFEMSPLNLPPLAVAGLTLRPSIQTFSIREDAAISRISVLGLFGDVPGTVSVNGQALLNVGWSPWGVEADLPNAGAGMAGPLVVSSNSIASPPVPITLWQGTAVQTLRLVSRFGAPGFAATANCVAAFRQNILETRANLESEPVRDAFGTFELQPIRSAASNRCTWNVSGEGRQNDQLTTAAPAADAVTTQSPPQFTNLYLGVAPGGRVVTGFAVPMPMHYITYDRDMKKLLEGDFSIGFDSARLVNGTVLSPAWRFDASFQGVLGTDARDTGSFELHLAPQFVPTASTPR